MMREIARVIDVPYQPYGDSPTIKSYTRWEEIGRHVGRGNVYITGALPTVLSESELRIENKLLREHFIHARAYVVRERTVTVKVEDAAAHIYGAPDVLITEGSGSIVMEGGGKDVLHIHRGGTVYVHIFLRNGSVTSIVRDGEDSHVRYDVEGLGGEMGIRGVAYGKRVDVVTNLFIKGGAKGLVEYTLLVPPGGFLVHRGFGKLLKGSKGGKVHMDSSYILAPGGFAVSVPSIEVYHGDVRGASHESRNLSLTEDQLFYMKTRGLSTKEAYRLYVEGIVKERVGEAYHYIEDIVETFTSLLDV